MNKIDAVKSTLESMKIDLYNIQLSTDDGELCKDISMLKADIDDLLIKLDVKGDRVFTKS